MCVHVHLHILCMCVCRGTRVTSVPAVLRGEGLACPSDLQIPSLVRSTQSSSFFRTHMCYTSQHTHTLRHPDGHTTYSTQTNCSLNQSFQPELGQAEQHFSCLFALRGISTRFKKINQLNNCFIPWKQLDVIRSFGLSARQMGIWFSFASCCLSGMT